MENYLANQEEIKVTVNGKEITLVSIVKVEKEKAEITYKVEKQIKEKKVVRMIYKRKNDPYEIVILKNIHFKVVFDMNGRGTQIGVINAAIESPVTKIKEAVIMNKLEIDEDVKHMKFEEIKACVESDVPVYLFGPAGSGKNHVLQQIADEINLDFYFTNSVQQEYKITGFIDAGGTYHETEFYKAFKNGGLFFLDEMDASIPEVLVLLNAALANKYFEFPNGKIFAHEDFRVVAAGNTVGTGADEQYSGRLQLDQATLDRFAMIEFDYDRRIELKIANGNVELVDFVRDLRKQAKQKGISATFSYRCISMVVKLESKLGLKEVLLIAVVKGMDKDTINTLNTNPTNKYSKALWEIKRVA